MACQECVTDKDCPPPRAKCDKVNQIPKYTIENFEKVQNIFDHANDN
jgi:hypothetical protein